MALGDLPLVRASVRDTATVAEAVAELFEAKVPAIAVLDERRRVIGIFSESDVLRAVFPVYLKEMRHTAFLPDEATHFDALAASVRNRPVRDFVRASETLRADDSQIHAAERLLHSGEEALPVLEGDRFLGMLSVAALCLARLGRAGTP
jgi:CBS domain-containing protein